MERKLVTIREITAIKPIDGADRIELAMIGGWQCVVKKGEFKVGDFGWYFEIDSFLPMKKEFEFLGKTKVIYTGEEGYRLRTIKLRGEISQGLLLPLNTFPEMEDVKMEDDYTEAFGVMLWTVPLPEHLGGISKSTFPSHIIPKTDQERIQNRSKWFEVYSHVDFEETEKMDGMSVTYFQYKEDFGACTRNQELTESDNIIWKIAKRNELKLKLSDIPYNIAIQGELCGPGIQRNRLQLKEVDFYVYDIWNIDEQRYLGCEERMDLVKILDLKHVPINVESVKILSKTMEEVLDHVKTRSFFGDFQQEGNVFKSVRPVDGKIISFKAINNNYLLKNKE